MNWSKYNHIKAQVVNFPGNSMTLGHTTQKLLWFPPSFLPHTCSQELRSPEVRTVKMERMKCVDVLKTHMCLYPCLTFMVRNKVYWLTNPYNLSKMSLYWVGQQILSRVHPFKEGREKHSLILLPCCPVYLILPHKWNQYSDSKMTCGSLKTLSRVRSGTVIVNDKISYIKILRSPQRRTIRINEFSKDCGIHEQYFKKIIFLYMSIARSQN